jgi:HEAT repeat protein
MNAIPPLPLGQPMITRLVLLAMVAGSLAGAVQAADAPDKTARLISVLRSDASLYDKARACQRLGEIGNRDAVPALASLLADRNLNAYARSGLEGIPDPGAAAALREAAARLKGPLLAGVVNSLGVVRDNSAVELLCKLAAEPASGVVDEALLALGNISSPGSIRALQDFLAKGPDSTRRQAAAGLLLAADRQRTEGDLKQAAALYEAVRGTNVPTSFRVGATKGAILSRTADRIPFLLEQLRSSELPIRNAALLTIRDIADEKLAAALNAELARANPELQRQILLALGDCHNTQSVGAVQALAADPDPNTRKTGLTVLGRLGPTATPALLAALHKDLQPDEKAIVLDGLRAMQGPGVDDLLLQAVPLANPTVRSDLIRLLGSRNVAKANGELLKQAAAEDTQVAVAALSALTPLAGPQELPRLRRLIQSAGDKAVREAAELAIAAACSRCPDEAAGAGSVLAELKKATQLPEKQSWIRVLATLGYAKALPDLEAAANDPDEALAATALEQLGRWPDPAPVETLLKSASTATTPSLRRRALASLLDLAAAAADEAQRPEATIVQWLLRADSLAASPAEKRRILGILGRLKTIESFRILASHLDDPDLRTEAASGILQITPALVKRNEAGTIKPAVERIAASVTNTELRDRAIQLLKTFPAQGTAVQLFDGRSLQGWEGNTNVWRVRDGVIIGGFLAGNPKNEFLATTRSYSNFVLRLEYKLVGIEGFINSGVQFRSVRVSDPPNEMSGYQADIGAGHSGCLYDESRRNKFLARCSDELIKRVEKEGEWNRYEVRCLGTQIQVWLNGEGTVDYREPEQAIPQNGRIALQIHGGNKAEVYFRNITLEEL